jgi:hypothetical protein
MRDFATARLARERGGALGDERLRPVYDSVSFHFVNDGRVNAVAFAEGARNFVGAYAGAPPLLADLCMTTLCSPRVWPGAGEAKDGREAAEHLRAFFRAVDLGREPEVDEMSAFRAGAFRMPSDPIRARLVNGLFSAAISFLFHHELGHVIRGHLDLLHERGRPMALFEADGAGVEADDPCLLQWLELDADRFGAWLTLDLFDWDGAWDAPLPADPEAFEDHPATALRQCFLAMGLVFLIFDQHREPLAANDRRAHPHPLVRMGALFSEVVSFLHDHHGAPWGACTEVMSAALLDLEQVGRDAGLYTIGAAVQETKEIEDKVRVILSTYREEDLHGAWERLRQRTAAG